MRIGILTGTFDPVHAGHVALAVAARERAGCDEVWLMVNPRPAHKVGVTAFTHRVAMAELAVAGLPGVQVYRGVLERRPQTMATFSELMAQQPGAEFAFIVGMDVLARLHGWDNPAAVVTAARFVVARRRESGLATVAEVQRRLGALGPALRACELEFDDGEVATSSEIRRQVAAGERPGSVRDAVWDYIQEHQLYR